MKKKEYLFLVIIVYFLTKAIICINYFLPLILENEPKIEFHPRTCYKNKKLVEKSYESDKLEESEKIYENDNYDEIGMCKKLYLSQLLRKKNI
jgi:hypothetical protein